MQTLALGEILWDIIEGKAHIGGSPFNVAVHLSKMGADSYLLSSVGADHLGTGAKEHALKFGVRTNYISTLKDKPTGTVIVELKDGQPDYTITEGVAWDAINLEDALLQELWTTSWDYLIFGSLAQRTVSNRALYQKILQNVKVGNIFFDVNLRQSYFDKSIIESSLQHTNILKLSDEEVEPISSLIYGKAFNFKDFAERISQAFDIHTICITRGGDGVLVYSENKFYDIPGVKVEVADTVGAGDSFSAAFLYTFKRTGNAALAAQRGCRLGAFVASSSGAVPDYTEELKEALEINV